MEFCFFEQVVNYFKTSTIKVCLRIYIKPLESTVAGVIFRRVSIFLSFL